MLQEDVDGYLAYVKGLKSSEKKAVIRRKGRTDNTVPAKTSSGSADIDARLRKLDRTQRHAVLATLSAWGPYTSLVAFVLTKDGKGIVFATPTATAKFRNMKRDARVSLLIDSRRNSERDYLGAEAMTIIGSAREVPEGARWPSSPHSWRANTKNLDPSSPRQRRRSFT